MRRPLHLRMRDWRVRSLMVPRLRRRNRVVMIRKGYVRVYAVQCFDEELDELRSIDEQRVGLLGAYIQRLVGVCGALPPLRVLCLGRDADVRSIPSGITSFLERSSGCWESRLRTAFARWHDDISIRRAMFHEVAHGLMDLQTGGFPYPDALEDGYARWSELVADKDLHHVRTLHAGKGPGGCLTSDQMTTIQELVEFKSPHVNTHSAETYWRFLVASIWLLMYLRFLDPIDPIPDRMLFGLRVHNIRTPGGVIEWLEKASGQRIVQLEEGFRLFCTEWFAY